MGLVIHKILAGHCRGSIMALTIGKNLWKGLDTITELSSVIGCVITITRGYGSLSGLMAKAHKSRGTRNERNVCWN